MRYALKIWANDLRNTIRDRTVSALLFVPLLLAIFLRLAFPVAERYLPQARSYHAIAAALFCMIAAMFPAFMTSFLMLDEKDEDLFSVFRTLPAPLNRLLLYRMLLVAVLSFLYALIIMIGSGLIIYAWPRIVALAFLCSLLSPAATLMVVSMATNKIEGLTLIKLLFFVIGMAPIGIVISTSWNKVFAILPPYWVYLAFTATEANLFLAGSIASIVIHLLGAILFFRVFIRRHMYVV